MRSTVLNILRSEITINIKTVSWKVVATFFFFFEGWQQCHNYDRDGNHNQQISGKKKLYLISQHSK